MGHSPAAEATQGNGHYSRCESLNIISISEHAPGIAAMKPPLDIERVAERLEKQGSQSRTVEAWPVSLRTGPAPDQRVNAPVWSNANRTMLQTDRSLTGRQQHGWLSHSAPSTGKRKACDDGGRSSGGPSHKRRRTSWPATLQCFVRRMFSLGSAKHASSGDVLHGQPQRAAGSATAHMQVREQGSDEVVQLPAAPRTLDDLQQQQHAVQPEKQGLSLEVIISRQPDVTEAAKVSENSLVDAQSAESRCLLTGRCASTTAWKDSMRDISSIAKFRNYSHFSAAIPLPARSISRVASLAGQHKFGRQHGTSRPLAMPGSAIGHSSMLQAEEHPGRGVDDSMLSIAVDVEGTHATIQPTLGAAACLQLSQEWDQCGEASQPGEHAGESMATPAAPNVSQADLNGGEDGTEGKQGSCLQTIPTASLQMRHADDIQDQAAEMAPKAKEDAQEHTVSEGHSALPGSRTRAMKFSTTTEGEHRLAAMARHLRATGIVSCICALLC
jgi:hypothetical protein